VALVKPSAENTLPLTLQPCVEIAGYVPSPAVVSHRRQHFLYHDLSALISASVTASSSDPSLVDVAQGMRDMVTEARLDQCWVDDDDNLSQVYHEWAAHPRGVSKRYTLQQSVDSAATILDVPSFEVTPPQVMAFKNFRYTGSSYFDIGSGLLSFSITPTDATSVQAWAMLAADRVRADAFDLGDDPESGAVAPGEVSRLRNLSGYT
jgi:hypothetical protein